MTLSLLALSGSARRASHNLHLVKAMAKGAEAAGATVTVIDWSQFVLPVFNEDIEAELPAAALELKRLFAQAQGFLIAEPEYNGGYSALMKNAIDWVSRPMPGTPAGSVFKNKTVVIAGATTGRWGAVRSVRVAPGCTTFTWMPEGPNSSAMFLARAATATLRMLPTVLPLWRAARPLRARRRPPRSGRGAAHRRSGRSTAGS